MGILLFLSVVLISGCILVSNPTKTPLVIDEGLYPSGFRVATLNVHYIYEGQKRLNWDRRKNAVVEVIREGDPDIIAFQEMETFAGSSFNHENKQLQYVLDHLAEYSVASIGDAESYPSTQPILYKTQRFEHLDQGFFFFSPTPDIIYSRPWEGRWTFYCSWSEFMDKERGRSFFLFNVHYDTFNTENKVKTTDLILSRIPKDKALIIAGDLNTLRGMKPFTLFDDHGLSWAETRGSTFHFNIGLNLYSAIDHIFFSRDFAQTQSLIIRKKYEGVYPSDHYPVFVDFAWAASDF